MYIYYIIFGFHSEKQCPTTHPHIELSIPMVVVTPGYTHGANTRWSGLISWFGLVWWSGGLVI